MASRDAVVDLRSHVDCVLAVVKDVIGLRADVWVSDESCLSDFFDGTRDRSRDQLLYDQIGERLGIPLDRANDDDHYIVRIALKLRLREGSSS